MKYLLVLTLIFVNQMAYAKSNKCVDLMQKQSYYEAADVCKIMAKKGERNAQFSLAVMYYQGNGMMSNMNDSQKWMRKAALQNHNQAQYNLGLMIANGQGSEADLIEAYAWLTISAENGYSVANDSVQQLGSELSSSEKKQTVTEIARIKKSLKQ
ncbi:MAG: sel1 repeat family protein [Gammaproteobacteria bacterium]|nr:sel1 repeat family protein [Gammaproteobacteria bacterium]